MEIENQIIEKFNNNNLNDIESCYIKNSIINLIDLEGVFELNTFLSIENSIVYNLNIHSCWFNKGLEIKNCIIYNAVNFQMGGHNKKPIIMQENIFKSFFNFFDCRFEDVIILKYNVFLEGTNLLGNKGEGFENTFQNGYLIEDNLGDFNLNIII